MHGGGGRAAKKAAVTVIVDALEQPLVVRGGRPVFAFETTGSDSWPVWDRCISLRGGPKFHLGNVCNTCYFFFSRISDGTPDTEPGQTIARQLNAGISALSDAPIQEIAGYLPDGDYQVVLSIGTPHLVHPGDPNDFFAVEQAQLRRADNGLLPHGFNAPRRRPSLLRICCAGNIAGASAAEHGTSISGGPWQRRNSARGIYFRRQGTRVLR